MVERFLRITRTEAPIADRLGGKPPPGWTGMTPHDRGRQERQAVRFHLSYLPLCAAARRTYRGALASVNGASARDPLRQTPWSEPAPCWAAPPVPPAGAVLLPRARAFGG